MKITDIEVHIVDNPWKPWTLCRVHTDAGIVGVSEATVYGHPRAVAVAIEEAERFFIGTDPRDTQAMQQSTLRLWRTGTIGSAVVAAVEIASWDILGKQLGAPVHALLGKHNVEPLRCYANSWYRAERDPETFAALAKQVVDRGYTAMKLDPFGTTKWRMDRKEFDLSVVIVREVRQAIGPDVDLMIEGHGRFTTASAIEVGRAIEPYRPAWFEEPVASDRMEELARIRRRVSVPLAAGERLYDRHEFRALLETHAVDVIQPDVLYVGGIGEFKAIAEMADAFGVALAPHNAEGPLASVAAMHAAATIPNFLILESFEEFNERWTAELVQPPIRIDSGHAHVPSGNGLGVEINMAQVKEHPFREEHFMDLYTEGWEKRTGQAESGRPGTTRPSAQAGAG